MEGNWRPTQSATAEASMASSMDASSAGAGGDWRSQLQPEARQRIVNKIMETLKRHLPISDPEGLNELRKIAIRFEDKIYTAATSQSDYLRKISLKMLSMETKNPPAAPINPGMPNPAAVNQNPTDPGIIYESVTLNCPNKRLQISPKRSIIDCESCSVSEEDSSTKRMKVSEPVPEKVAPEELAFTCPICMCALVTPFSTFCGHVFCEVCIKAATQRQKKCPTCRTKLIGRNAIHRIYIPCPTVD